MNIYQETLRYQKYTLSIALATVIVIVSMVLCCCRREKAMVEAQRKKEKELIYNFGNHAKPCMPTVKLVKL